MSTQHTPGPWSVFASKRAKVVSVCIGEKANGRQPCIVNWPGFDSCGLPINTQWANARLIASAPDLLAALQHLDKAYDESTEMPCAEVSNKELAEAWGAARAAIQKATGAA